ncbi:RING finger protein 214 [Rhinoraja longicauda]
MEPVEVLDSEEKPEVTSGTLSLEHGGQIDDASCTGEPAETKSVTTMGCDTALETLTLSDSNSSPSDQEPPSADLDVAVFTTPGSPAQDGDIYMSDPENEAEEALASCTPDILAVHGLPETGLGDQPSVPYHIDCGEDVPPAMPNYPEQGWLPDASEGRDPKPFADESCGHSAGYWQNPECTGTVLADEEVMVKPQHEEKPGGGPDAIYSLSKELPPLKSLEDSAVQTDCFTVDAEVSTDQDIERYMNEVATEREVLKDRYQEVLDRQTQVENQLQVKVRHLQEQQEEEENIYQENVKQIKEMKVKLEELKKKSEKEKREFAEKEQELKNEVERLYENGKRLMKEQEEKGNLVAILISNHSDKKEMLNEDLAKLQLQHNKLNKNILEETERALKAEVQSLESKREIAVMMLEQAANEAELQICNLRPQAGSSNLAREWQRRLNDIQVQTETIKKQYEDHIRMIRNGAKLNSLPPIQMPPLPPPPAQPDLPSQANWHPSPTLPPYFPSSMPPSAAFPPVAFYPPHLPPAPRFPPGLGPPAEVNTRGTPPVANPASKLEKLFDKLELKFPHCSRLQLMHILQRIKTSRGTIAGLSVEELVQQVAECLGDPDQCLPSGPPRVPVGMPGHFPPAAAQTTPYMAVPKGKSGRLPSCQERPALVPGSPRLCLMCQKVVLVGEVHQMACSHIVHKECIKFWAHTNKNSSCPFCPTPR